MYPGLSFKMVIRTEGWKLTVLHKKFVGCGVPICREPQVLPTVLLW